MMNHIETIYGFTLRDIHTVKITFHSAGRTPINAGHIFQIDIIIKLMNQKTITLDTNIFSTNDDKLKELISTVCHYAIHINDPFHIIDHISLDRESFYQYLNQIYQKREHLRVFGKES